MRGIHRWPVNSPHKGAATQKMFPLDDVIMCAWVCLLTLVAISFLRMYVMHLLIRFKVASLAIGYTYDCPDASESILKDMGKIDQYLITTKHNKAPIHNDFIKWKHFLRYRPLWGKSTGHRWIPITKASDAELWLFLWSTPEQTVEQLIEAPVIWDAIAFIIMSL